jgi:hypothetical protein
MRVIVWNGDRSELLGEGVFESSVTVYFGQKKTSLPNGDVNLELVSLADAEKKPTPEELGEGVDVLTISDCPKIVLDNGKVVYGCQVWWEPVVAPKREVAVDEANGIKAIIFLQNLGGITETEEQARAGWNAMSDQEKEFTIEMYVRMDGDAVDARRPAAVAL